MIDGRSVKRPVSHTLAPAGGIFLFTAKPWAQKLTKQANVARGFQTGLDSVIPLDLNGIIAFDAGSARGAQHCIEEPMRSSGNGPG
jgi:hypothetical protein